ncbi:MAG TPA: energy transducer TonB [Opitutaceae bacterium]
MDKRWFYLACGSLVATAAFAQKTFVVLENDVAKVVREVRFGSALVEVDGKMRKGSGMRYALRDVAVYGEGFITVLKFEVGTSHMEFIGSGARLNREIEIRGRLSSETALQRCFFVLEITSGRDKGVLFAEIPDLVLGKIEGIYLRFPLADDLDESHYRLHFFSDGLEILYSKMPPGYIEEHKRKTEAFLLRDQPDRAPRPVSAVKPVYPADHLARGTNGTATVRCKIDRRGGVSEAAVLRATDPAFGESAVEAVRQWKFDPAVKNHQHIAVTVDIPFNFKPPPLPVKTGEGGGAAQPDRP